MNAKLTSEELAEQRLNQFAHAYTLFAKNLMEAGVDWEIIKGASDKTWGSVGEEVGKQLNSRFEQADPEVSIRQAGAYAMSIYGNEISTVTSGNKTYSELVKCPWHDAAEKIGIPYEWRFCESGHSSFVGKMLEALRPDIIYI